MPKMDPAVEGTHKTSDADKPPVKKKSDRPVKPPEQAPAAPLPIKKISYAELSPVIRQALVKPTLLLLKYRVEKTHGAIKERLFRRSAGLVYVDRAGRKLSDLPARSAAGTRQRRADGSPARGSRPRGVVVASAPTKRSPPGDQGR